jgi:hypothetical protein
VAATGRARGRHIAAVSCLVGAVVGCPAALGQATLVARAWAACDVGISGANALVLLLGLPVLWLMDSAVFALAAAGVSRMTQSRTAGLLAGLAAAVLATWLLFAWQGTPSDYPSPLCHDNIPPWWPSWLPA